MEKKYYKILEKLLETSVSLIGNPNYTLSISVKGNEDDAFVDIGRIDSEKVAFIRSIFTEKKTEKPLLIFNAERWLCSIEKSKKEEDVHDVYENFLANTSSVKRREEQGDDFSMTESNWWKTLNEFINAVQYAAKMKNGLKDLGGQQP